MVNGIVGLSIPKNRAALRRLSARVLVETLHRFARQRQVFAQLVGRQAGQPVVAASDDFVG
jgi:hypothetical protein